MANEWSNKIDPPVGPSPAENGGTEETEKVKACSSDGVSKDAEGSVRYTNGCGSIDAIVKGEEDNDREPSGSENLKEHSESGTVAASDDGRSETRAGSKEGQQQSSTYNDTSKLYEKKEQCRNVVDASEQQSVQGQVGVKVCPGHGSKGGNQSPEDESSGYSDAKCVYGRLGKHDSRDEPNQNSSTNKLCEQSAWLEAEAARVVTGTTNLSPAVPVQGCRKVETAASTSTRTTTRRNITSNQASRSTRLGKLFHEFLHLFDVTTVGNGTPSHTIIGQGFPNLSLLLLRLSRTHTTFLSV